MSVTHWSYESHQLFLSDLATPALADGYVLGKFAQTDLALTQSWADPSCVFLFLRGKTQSTQTSESGPGGHLPHKYSRLRQLLSLLGF